MNGFWAIFRKELTQMMRDRTTLLFAIGVPTLELILFGVIGTFTTVPLMMAIGRVGNPITAFVLVLLALIGASFYTSISGLVKAELFPIEIRALAMGLSYAIANALFGGTIEYVALWFKSKGVESAFFWYVSALAAVALIASWTMRVPEVYGHLRDADERV